MFNFIKSLFKKQPRYVWESFSGTVVREGRSCIVLTYKDTKTNQRHEKLIYDRCCLYKRAADIIIEDMNYKANN